MLTAAFIAAVVLFAVFIGYRLGYRAGYADASEEYRAVAVKFGNPTIKDQE